MLLLQMWAWTGCWSCTRPRAPRTPRTRAHCRPHTRGCPRTATSSPRTTWTPATPGTPTPRPSFWAGSPPRAQPRVLTEISSGPTLPPGIKRCSPALVIIQKNLRFRSFDAVFFFSDRHARWETVRGPGENRTLFEWKQQGGLKDKSWWQVPKLWGCRQGGCWRLADPGPHPLWRQVWRGRTQETEHVTLVTQEPQQWDRAIRKRKRQLAKVRK